MTSVMRQREWYVALGVVTLMCGLVMRFAPLGLPWFVVKYGGSTMWALMVYWVLAFSFPRSRVGWLAVAAGVIAALVEFQRLYHSPGLDAFRHSLAGILLLGNFFSLRDIVAYWLAIAVGAVVDRVWVRAARI
jgi:uncharacterized membrane protein HdeD (DUF308 family)